ncbi:toll/interleukin-1 receptor domain-containing protein [Methylobacterium durans]|uniref:toll/interleukin-1 receptor domain-containing protein n=1 Tax=Methylobacterium durans TaxID=2202825 RepID=UPI001F413E20|nr:TIR domain-containing protein [Methylobacterium durans]
MATVFFSYSHRDEDLRDRLEVHLTMLKRQGAIEAWHDRRLIAGDEFGGGIHRELERADVILLLVSPDFLASDYCYDIEMRRALERHGEGSARVIPVILHHCDWHSAPFGKLLAAPRDGKPVASWPDLNEAFLDIVQKIRAALPGSRSRLPGAPRRTRHPPPRGRAPATSASRNPSPRSTVTASSKSLSSSWPASSRTPCRNCKGAIPASRPASAGSMPTVSPPWCTGTARPSRVGRSSSAACSAVA